MVLAVVVLIGVGCGVAQPLRLPMIRQRVMYRKSLRKTAAAICFAIGMLVVYPLALYFFASIPVIIMSIPYGYPGVNVEVDSAEIESREISCRNHAAYVALYR